MQTKWNFPEIEVKDSSTFSTTTGNISTHYLGGKRVTIAPLKLTSSTTPQLSCRFVMIETLFPYHLPLMGDYLIPVSPALYTLSLSHNSRHRWTVFVAGLSLWRAGVNWMVTGLPARRVVWCSVWTESSLDPPPQVFDENQTDLAGAWASTEADSAHLSCHTNSGTAWDRWDYALPGRDVTSPGGLCCLQRETCSFFSTISYHGDSDETIQGKNRRMESWTIAHLLSQNSFSVPFNNLLTGLSQGLSLQDFRFLFDN